MSSIPLREKLNPPQAYKTNFPFPIVQQPKLLAKLGTADKPFNGTTEKLLDGRTMEMHLTEKVQVQVCSELTMAFRPVELFDNAGVAAKEGQRELSLIHDTNGQPLAFCVSKDGVRASTDYLPSNQPNLAPLTAIVHDSHNMYLTFP